MKDQENHIVINDKNWIDNEIDLKWFKQCFESKIKRCKMSKYRLLLLNDHNSLLIFDVINFCIENDIILLCLFAHVIDTL